MFSSNRRINRLGHVFFFVDGKRDLVHVPTCHSLERGNPFLSPTPISELPTPGCLTPCHYRKNGNPPLADAVYPVRYEKAENTSDFALSLISAYERA